MGLVLKTVFFTFLKWNLFETRYRKEWNCTRTFIILSP